MKKERSENKLIAFFCATPFQLITAVLIKECNYSRADVSIYLLDYFEDAEGYVERVRKTGLFKEVNFIKAWEIYQRIHGVGRMKATGKLARIIWKIFHYTNYKRTLIRLGIRVHELEQVFFSHMDPICILLGRYEKKKHQGIRFMGFEDGNGSYIRELDENRKILEKIFKIPIQVFAKEKYWLYQPEQVIEYSRYANKLESIRVRKSIELSHFINVVWENISEYYIRERFIFLDGLDNTASLDLIIPELIKECGVNNIICKIHPRRKDRYYEEQGINLWREKSVPLEAFFLEHDISDKILICNYSSACFNAKFMFDQEPVVIFLCKLMNKPTDVNQVLSLITKLQSVYLNKNKIYIPNDKNELINVLRSFSLVENKNQ